MKKKLIYELLQECDPYRLMVPDNNHPEVLGELADIIAGLLPIIFEKSWRLGEIPGDWKKASVILIYKKG